MTRILLVRHGQSEWNATGRWQGRADPPLSEHGRRQSVLAAERLGSVDVIVSSPLERARHTADIVSELLGIGPVAVEDDLVERDAGEWSGLTRAEIEESWPGYLAERRRPPGYEPEDRVLARTVAVLDRLHATFPGGEVLVITHGGVIGTVEHHLGAPWVRLANLAARWVTHHGDTLALGERVVLVDDDAVTVPAQI